MRATLHINPADGSQSATIMIHDYHTRVKVLQYFERSKRRLRYHLHLNVIASCLLHTLLIYPERSLYSGEVYL